MYKRVLLKLSGEALGIKSSDNIIDVESLNSICEKIKILHDDGLEVAIVIGAGNIWRGKVAEKIGIERVPADYMGMLGTVINAVAMSSALKKMGVESIVYSAIPEIKGVTFAYDADKVKKDLSQGKICFLAGGTGKPFFTTDTAATLRAIETKCDEEFLLESWRLPKKPPAVSKPSTVKPETPMVSTVILSSLLKPANPAIPPVFKYESLYILAFLYTITPFGSE